MAAGDLGLGLPRLLGALSDADLASLLRHAAELYSRGPLNSELFL